MICLAHAFEGHDRLYRQLEIINRTSRVDPWKQLVRLNPPKQIMYFEVSRKKRSNGQNKRINDRSYDMIMSRVGAPGKHELKHDEYLININSDSFH